MILRDSLRSSLKWLNFYVQLRTFRALSENISGIQRKNVHEEVYFKYVNFSNKFCYDTQGALQKMQALENWIYLKTHSKV